MTVVPDSKVFGIAGWSGSGKTTLMIRLVPALVRRGVRVATIKHTHHNPTIGDGEIDALCAAGAVEAVIASPERVALIHDLANVPEPGLAELVTQVRGVDLLLVEGFKFAPHPKLEVWDPDLAKPMLAPVEASVVALACDVVTPHHGRPVFRRDAVDAIADFILDYCKLS